MSPCTRRMRSCGTPRIECATCDSVVSRPWPWLCAPIRSSSPPSGVKRAHRRLVARHQRDAPGGIDAGAVGRPARSTWQSRCRCAGRRARLALALAHLVEADGRDGPAQGLGVVAGIEVALGDVVEGHLLGPHQAFKRSRWARCPACARARRASPPARSTRRCGRRRGRAGSAACWWPPNRRGSGSAGNRRGPAGSSHLPRLQAGGERIGRVGAGVDGRLAVERQQAAVRVGVGGEDVVVLAAIGVGGEVSRRSSIHLSGTPSLRATQASATSSGSRMPL